MIDQIDAERAHSNSRAQQAAPKPLDGVFDSLIAGLQKALRSEAYTTPTPIQQQCIPSLLGGRDVLGSAQTGTGKTAAFTLPLLQRLDDKSQRRGAGRPNKPKALILAPTRELAAQIGDSVRAYGRFLTIHHTVIFGGVSQHRQVKDLQRGVDIVVATPGRLLDLIEQGHARLDEVEFLVLDEVDRMLDMGFIHDIRKILSRIPARRQTAFFSATMPPEMVSLAAKMVCDPVRVTIAPDEPAVDRILQKMLFVRKSDKGALLASILDDTAITKAIIFTQMKHAANRVAKKLTHAGVECAALHGNKSQSARTRALDGFKRGQFRVLVATDVAARGIDVDDITHVINYDLPVEAETYVHRIGRTARAGTGGDAISFCCVEERPLLGSIEKLLGEPVPADTDHAFHCEDTRRSTCQPKSQLGRRNGGRQPSRKGSRGTHRRRRNNRRRA